MLHWHQRRRGAAILQPAQLQRRGRHGPARQLAGRVGPHSVARDALVACDHRVEEAVMAITNARHAVVSRVERRQPAQLSEWVKAFTISLGNCCCAASDPATP